MRFNAWCKEIELLCKRTVPLIIDEEMLTAQVPSEKVTIYVGDKIKWSPNYNTVRRAYTASNKEWAIALGELKTKVEIAESLNEKLLKLHVAPYMKEAVIDRMVNNNDIPDNGTILRMAAVKRNQWLMDLLPGNVSTKFSGDFPLSTPSKTCSLMVKYISGRNPKKYIVWGDSYSRADNSAKENLSFLNHYEQHHCVVQELAKNLRPIVKLAEDTEDKGE